LGLIEREQQTERWEGGKREPPVAVTGIAVAGESHFHGAVADERDEAEPVREELVVEHRGVGLDLHQVDGQRGHFRDHDAPQRIGNAGVRVAQLELHHIVLHVADAHCWKPLIRHILHPLLLLLLSVLFSAPKAPAKLRSLKLLQSSTV
jgi:hypothetical protein